MARSAKARGKPANLVVWFILGLLVLALGGFGIGSFGGAARTVATVGDAEITIDEYARALEQERSRLSEMTGQSLTGEQMRRLGLDAQVMERLLAAAALREEAEALGVSVGDVVVAEQIRALPAFQGAGGFDREAYAFALRNAGLDERTFEEGLRADRAAQIVQDAVVGGVAAPEGYARTVAAWLAETRDVAVIEVTTDQLDGGAVAPTEEELAAFHAENAAVFETPERRRITFAWADPGALAAETPVSDAEVEALYEANAGDYRLPRRVLAERLAFSDEAAARAAAEAIAAGERTFEDLVEARGLSLADVDQGELAEGDLDPELAADLFALDEPGIVGPVATDLGPALYRVNAVLAARVTPIEEVRDELERMAAADAARRAIDAAREEIDDLLAGGATLEEVAAETVMELGTVAYDEGEADGIAGYEAFRAAAGALEEGDFPELVELADGGLVALRLDGVDPAATPPLDAIRAQVEAAWQARSLAQRLAVRAEVVADALRGGETIEALGLSADVVTGIERDGAAEGLTTEVVAAVFEAAPGDVLALPGDEARAFVVRVDAIERPEPDDERVAPLVEAIEAQARQEVAGDLFSAYAAAVRDAAGFTIDQTAVEAVQAQVLGGG